MTATSPARTTRVALLILAASVISGCATTTSNMVSSWVDPDHGTQPIRKILVIGLANDPTMRKTFETKMVGILEREKVASVASYTVMPEIRAGGDEAAARAIIVKAVTEAGADAVTITRLVSEETSQQFVQGGVYAAPYPYYGGMYPYYYNSYSVAYTPSYVVENKLYVIETNLYDVATEKLVWTGVSETLNPSSAVLGVESVGKTIVRTLRSEGLIGR